MRIGIIGGGASGLLTAWLLQDHHQVWLFEKEDRLGGHAHTVEVEHNGTVVAIDAAFEFFSESLYPTFDRLLRILRVPVQRFPATVTLYGMDHGRVHLLPPFRSRPTLRAFLDAESFVSLFRLRRVVSHAARLVEAGDSSLTIECFLNSLHVSNSYKDRFLYPFLASGWGVRVDEFRRFSAYDVLKYLVFFKPQSRAEFFWNEIVGGTRAYVQALSSALTKTRIAQPAEICGICRSGGCYVVRLAGGGSFEFEQLVVATNAYQARALLARLDGVEEAQRELSRIEYFKTRIAIHGDQRWMPAARKHWSVLNIRCDSASPAGTICKPWKSETVFRSWVTHSGPLPEPVYALHSYYHPKVTPEYFEAQRALARAQGRRNLWFAGMYTQDIDCHESAIRSAVNVAEQLEPRSANLALLAGTRSTSGQESWQSSKSCCGS